MILETIRAMASVYLQTFLDSLQSLPIDMRRNLTLLRDLDDQALGLCVYVCVCVCYAPLP